MDEAGAVRVTILPTYSGCPAMGVIALGVETELAVGRLRQGEREADQAPAWSTDLMSEEGREKLRAYGIAPPGKDAGKRALFSTPEVGLSALRIEPDGTHLRIRLDGLQGAVPLHGLPRALRAFQMHLTRPS